jgi:hypothetical protein
VGGTEGGYGAKRESIRAAGLYERGEGMCILGALLANWDTTFWDSQRAPV